MKLNFLIYRSSDPDEPLMGLPEVPSSGSFETFWTLYIIKYLCRENCFDLFMTLKIMVMYILAILGYYLALQKAFLLAVNTLQLLK